MALQHAGISSHLCPSNLNITLTKQFLRVEQCTVVHNCIAMVYSVWVPSFSDSLGVVHMNVYLHKKKAEELLEVLEKACMTEDQCLFWNLQVMYYRC